MTSNRHIYFRWTPRTARITFMYAIVVPALVGFIGYKSDVSQDELLNSSRRLKIYQFRGPMGQTGAVH